MSGGGAVIERRVKPVGNLLNDNDSGVDELGYHIYAQALAKLLHGCRPPLTVGIFGPWGIGKTFMLKLVQGLLTKCEQQQNYDKEDIKTNSECGCGGGGSSTEVDGTAPKGKLGNRSRTTNLRRACTIHTLPIVALCLIVVLFVVLLVLVFSRSLRSETGSSELESTTLGWNETGSGSRKIPKGRSSPLVPEAANLTDSSSEPPEWTTDYALGMSRGARLFLILLLVAVTGTLLTIFCCCVSDTNSKSWSRFRKNYKLVFYAAFTRVPSAKDSPNIEWTEADTPHTVKPFDDRDAETCLYDSVDEESIMPSKYIFVNYHAWQYAGADTLWAGIVTNLSEAIEEEFGAVCARLFRMMQVERPSKSGPIKVSMRGKEDPRALYVRFSLSGIDAAEKRKRVMLIMKEYGVVTRCCAYQGQWWYVRFSCDEEADFAKSDLELGGYEITRVDPAAKSRSRLVGMCSRSCNSVEMQNLCPHNTGELRAQDGRSLEEESQSCCTHFRRHPRTSCCGCPFLYCCLVFLVTAVVFPIAIMVLADHLELSVIKSARSIPLVFPIIAWCPAFIGVLFVVLRFCWAMCHSQTERIRKALAGTKGSMANALGFMNDVKREVMIMTQLINCVRFSHGVDYKIVITIDDLDRCPYEKVKSVLEAVSILLSDRSSPFLCLIAVDSRVAVKCIEQDMGDVLLQAHLTGHEYLKKIINLPFCLPEVADDRKRKYFHGITDMADLTKIARVERRGRNLSEDAMDAELDSNDGEEEVTTQLDGGSDSPRPNRNDARFPGQPNEDEKRFNKFLLDCRKVLCGEGEVGRFVRKHIRGNPRNLKRIFNVLSLSTHLMKCVKEQRKRLEYLTLHSSGSRNEGSDHQSGSSIVNSDVLSLAEDVKAEDLVKWIVATDQWPYRISYILQVVEDSDQRRKAGIDEPIIEDSCKLSKVYETVVEPEIAQETDACCMLDHDPVVLRSFLRGSPELTRQKVTSLFPVTLNLDQSLRNGISRQRAKLSGPPEKCDKDVGTDTAVGRNESDEGQSASE